MVQGLAEELVVRPVASGDLVARAQSCHGRGGLGLLADAAVHGAPDAVEVLQPQELALEAANEGSLEQDPAGLQRIDLSKIFPG